MNASERSRKSKAAVSERYRVAFRAFNGHDMYVHVSENNAWYTVDGQKLRSHQLLERAERLERAVAAKAMRADQ